MSSINWKYHASGRELDWKTCQDLHKYRAWIVRAERRPGEDPRLPRRVIAPYTDLFFDSEKNCFVVCVRFWSGHARFRKILEIYENDVWKIYGDASNCYNNLSTSGGNDHSESRDVVGRTWYKAHYVKDDIQFTNFARTRLNQMLPVNLYSKRVTEKGVVNIRWFINNNQHRAQNGLRIDYHTNLNYPKWWNMTASPFSSYHHDSTQERKDAKTEWSAVIRDYSEQFSTKCCQDKRRHGASWVDGLQPYFGKEDLVTRNNQICIAWSCLEIDKPEAKLYKIIWKRERFPPNLLREALTSFLIDKNYINIFMQNYLTSELWRLQSVSFVKDILIRYLDSFCYRFAFMRSHRLHDDLIAGNNSTTNRWGPGLHLMNTW